LNLVSREIVIFYLIYIRNYFVLAVNLIRGINVFVSQNISLKKEMHSSSSNDPFVLIVKNIPVMPD